ncbi:flagellar hook-length control protein FliK [bacterium]|nr:MAG: flagellar hook-length control protein FliK [bacterium]
MTRFDTAVSNVPGEEGAAPRSAVTSAAGSPPSPGTLLTAVSNLVNGDVAVARGATAAQDAPLREQLGTPRWQEELGNRITLMAAQGQHSGSLRLNPEHLGPVEVQITVGEERTHVQFGAQNADTRQALQDALPRLREMFASAGLQLGQAGVSHQSPRQRPDGAPGASGGSTGGISGIGDGEPTHLATPVRRITHSGLLDTYA